MGEGTAGVDQRPRELENEVEALRGNLTGIVSELDHRRHELLDWRLQLRRHSGLVALIAGAAVALVGGSIALGIVRRRREQRALTRVKKMRRAVARFVDDPDRVVPKEPSIGRKALGAAAAAAAGTAGRKGVERLLGRVRAGMA